MPFRLRRYLLTSLLLGTLFATLLCVAHAEGEVVIPTAPSLDPRTGSPAPELTTAPVAETPKETPTETPAEVPLAETPVIEVPPPPAAQPSEVAAPPAQSQASLDDTGTSFHRVRPNWGVQLYGTLSALGSRKGPLIASRPTSSATAIAVDFDFEPAIIQAAGVLGVGISAGMFPTSDADDIVSSPFSIYQVGVHAKYQARFFREQILVPYVGFNVERLSYSFVDASTGLTVKESVVHQYPVFGGMLLLNLFEPSQAHEAFRDWGIVRSYLLGEVRTISLGDRPLALSGTSYFFGLRVEY